MTTQLPSLRVLLLAAATLLLCCTAVPSVCAQEPGFDGFYGFPDTDPSLLTCDGRLPLSLLFTIDEAAQSISVCSPSHAAFRQTGNNEYRYRGVTDAGYEVANFDLSVIALNGKQAVCSGSFSRNQNTRLGGVQDTLSFSCFMSPATDKSDQCSLSPLSCLEGSCYVDGDGTQNPLSVACAGSPSPSPTSSPAPSPGPSPTSGPGPAPSPGPTPTPSPAPSSPSAASTVLVSGWLLCHLCVLWLAVALVRTL